MDTRTTGFALIPLYMYIYDTVKLPVSTLLKSQSLVVTYKSWTRGGLYWEQVREMYFLYSKRIIKII